MVATAQVAPTYKPARVLVEWEPVPPETNVFANVVGYKIYYGTNSRIYQVVVDAGSETNLITTNHVRGLTYYFAATGYNIHGVESEYSEEAILAIPPLPPFPTGLQATNEPMVVLSAHLESAHDPAGPWTDAAIYPTNTFDTGGAAFFRVIMGIDLPQ